MMSFDDFLEATREHERRVCEGLPSEPPYFGSDVFWRNSMADNGFVQNIGERMKSDLLGGANFASLRTLMEAGIAECQGKDEPVDCTPALLEEPSMPGSIWGPNWHQI